MNDESLAMGTAFSKWQNLTDEYAREVRSLQCGDPLAPGKLARIARELKASGQWQELPAPPGAMGRSRLGSR